MNKTTAFFHTILQKINAVRQSMRLPALEFSEQGDGHSVFRSKDAEYRLLCRTTLSASAISDLLQNAGNSDFLLLLPYIAPADAELLRTHRIQYADMAGNLFLCGKKQLIAVLNCAKPPQLEQKRAIGRTGTTTGLKLLFLLLTEKDSLNWTYREMAKYSGVSLGSIRYVMADLKAAGAVLTVNGKLLWKDFPAMAEKWSEGYLEKILPQVSSVRYEGTIPAEDENSPLLKSGESAGICRKLLKSNRLLAYKTGSIAGCILKNHWRETADGPIEIRHPFWPAIRDFKQQIPPLLVYADLLAEQDPRCREAATTIFAQHLKGDRDGRAN